MFKKVYSLYPAFCTQPAFYSESAVCILHTVFILRLVRSLRFTMTAFRTVTVKNIQFGFVSIVFFVFCMIFLTYTAPVSLLGFLDRMSKATVSRLKSFTKTTSTVCGPWSGRERRK